MNRNIRMSANKEKSVKRTKKNHMSSLDFMTNTQIGTFNNTPSSHVKKTKSGNKLINRKGAQLSLLDKHKNGIPMGGHKKQNTLTNYSVFKYLTTPRGVKPHYNMPSSRLEVSMIYRSAEFVLISRIDIGY